MKRVTHVVIACVLASGCVTDKLAIFDGNVLTDEEMDSYLGTYQLVAATEDGGKEVPAAELKHVSLEVSKKDKAYHFRYGESDGISSGSFVLSKVPDAKENLLLFASPKVKSTGQHPMTIDNVFFIMKREKDMIHVWVMLGDEAAAKSFPFMQRASQGGFRCQELLEFLKQHADEFVSKNPARLTFKKTR